MNYAGVDGNDLVLTALAPLATPAITGLSNDTGGSSTDKDTDNPALSLSGVETGATVEYQFSYDGGKTWSAWRSSYIPPQDGNVTVEARQEDSAGNISAASGSFTYTYDTAAPAVTGTTPSLTGGSVGAGMTSLAVTFSEPVVGGDQFGNYQLVSLGPDGLLGTDDDSVVPLGVAYTGTTATLSFAPLPASVYRLTVDDTITDLAGNQLDGDGNGTPGGNWTTDFVVLPAGAAPRLDGRL